MKRLTKYSRKVMAFMVMSLMCMTVFAQRNVTGVVTDESGEPLVGVSIQVKGTQTLTITDANGAFSLKDLKANAVLSASYLGFKQQELPVNGDNMTIVMQEDVESLEDVVVIGYGTAKRRDLTGSVASIAPKDITIAPTNNIMEALEGRIAGLDISQSSGAIGSNPSVSLRGERSIYGNNTPLIVIDGIMMPTTTTVESLDIKTADNSVVMNVNDYFSQINPADIESIDVLKDAASTAIYGSAGANGVILITTKKGKEGVTNVNFDFYYSLKGTPEFKHGMQGEEWEEYYKQAYKNNNGTELTDISTLFGGNQYYIDAYNNGQWIDWVDAAVSNGKQASSQRYSLSVSTGTAKSSIYTSAAYTKDQGLMSLESSDKVSFRFNAEQEIFKWAKIGLVSNMTYSVNNTGNPVFERSLGNLPLGKVYDETGALNYFYIGTDAGNGQISPLADWRTDQYSNKQKSFYAQPTAYLEIKPIECLSYKTQLGGSYANVYRGRYFGSECYTQSPHYVGYVTPYAEIYSQNQWGYTWDNIVTFNKTFNEDHNLVIAGITSWNFSQLTDTYAGGKDQELDSWQFYRIGAGNSSYVNNNYFQTQQMSYAGRASYSYKSKYLASVSVRYDGVSWLSEGKKWDLFPSAALAWRLSEEDFMEGADWLNNLKLRASYGITGNSGGMTAYATESGMVKYPANISVDGPNSPSAGGMTQYTGTYGNAGIGWEKSYTWNFGLDFAVLDNRLDGSVEYYTTKTDGLLYKRAMPVTTGLTGWGWTLSSWQNLGKTENKGLEITLNSRNIKRKNFTWNTSFNFTWQNDKIVSLPGGDFKDSSLGWFFEGESLSSVYAYKYVGIWQENEKEEAAKYGCEPGAVKIETVAQESDEVPGVHKYTENDMQVIGKLTPTFLAGMNNTFTLYDFDLSIYMMGRFGHLVEYSRYSGSASITSNQPAGTDYWTTTNTDAYYYAPGLNYNPAASACDYVKGDFIKIKNITLGYTLPRKVTSKALMNRVRIYATAYNPFVLCFSKQLNGVDPESTASKYPLYKQFTFGLNVTF